MRMPRKGSTSNGREDSKFFHVPVYLPLWGMKKSPEYMLFKGAATEYQRAELITISTNARL